MLTLDEVLRSVEEFGVDRLHALGVERAGVLDPAVGRGLDDAARAELLPELGVLRIVGILRFFLGVEVVEVAEELVEAMRGRQVLVAVAEVVLAELAGGVAIGLQDIGDAGIERPKAEFRAGQADLGQAGADR